MTSASLETTYIGEKLAKNHKLAENLNTGDNLKIPYTTPSPIIISSLNAFKEVVGRLHTKTTIERVRPDKRIHSINISSNRGTNYCGKNSYRNKSLLLVKLPLTILNDFSNSYFPINIVIIKRKII